MPRTRQDKGEFDYIDPPRKKKATKSVRILNGYRLVYDTTSPRAMTNNNWCGYVYEHILVAEKFLGRPLRRKEIVHHLDGNRGNNVVSNLLVLERSQHTKLHAWLASACTREIRTKNGVNSGKAKKEINVCRQCGCAVPYKGLTFCSTRCASKSRRKAPSKKRLTRSLKKGMSFSAIARKYGVSANTIKKWTIRYDLSCES